MWKLVLPFHRTPGLLVKQIKEKRKKKEKKIICSQAFSLSAVHGLTMTVLSDYSDRCHNLPFLISTLSCEV